MRVVDDLINAAVFNHIAHLQHHDVVGHLRNNGQIVGDIQRPNPGVADRSLDRHQHVDLRRHIQRGGGFVEHHQIGLRAQRKRGHAALQLTARHLVRIPRSNVGRVRQTQLVKQVDRAGFCIRLGELALADGRLNHLIQDPLGRIKAGRG